VPDANLRPLPPSAVARPGAFPRSIIGGSGHAGLTAVNGPAGPGQPPPVRDGAA